MTPQSTSTVVGIFATADQARSVVEELRRNGFPQSAISMIIRSDGAGQQIEPVSHAMKDAEIGAAAGGISGALLGLAAAAVPGIGPVLVMGPLMAALGGAGIGAIAGGLIGELHKAGVPHEEARNYAETVRRGDAIVTVRADSAMAERARRIMDTRGAIDLDVRMASWRKRGWSGHDPGLEPLSEDELRREREFYGSEWKPEDAKEEHHAGAEQGMLWPHKEAHDLGESLVEVAAPEQPLGHRARIYEVEQVS